VLEIDPYAAEIVRRIFAEFLAGKGYFAIAEGLTADGILSPSAYDPARNPHRCGIAWTKGAVRAILLNPRYTGRQVWNKQRKREVLIDVHNVALGHETKLTWNPKDAWVFSDDIVNPSIIDEETFAAVQRVMAARGRGPARHKPHRARRPYVLRACLHCGICHRRMEGSWNNDEAYYRCRFPEEYALVNRIQHPRNVYLREAALLRPLDAWLSTYFAPHRRAETIAALAAVTGTEPAQDATAALAEQTIAECDRKIARYRAALEALDESADPAVIAGWISEAQKQRDAARAQCQHRPRQEQMSEAEITALVDKLADLVQAITNADVDRKADLYAKLGLHLTYQPEKHEVRAEARLDPAPHGEMVGVRGGT
jgi:hypothetical protein